MIRKRIESGIITLALLFTVMFMIIIFNYFKLSDSPDYAATAVEKHKITISAGKSEGNIYDRNMVPLVNNEYQYIGIAVPNALDREEIAGIAADKNDFYTKFDLGKPFVFECNRYAEESAGLTVFRIPERYSENQYASHIIGYTSQGKGVAGIEKAYNSILRTDSGENSVTYITDGFGHVLIGDEKSVERSGIICSGVVTTLDTEIQKIVEEAGKHINKGAINVADIQSGDILAMASYPDYSVGKLDEAINDIDSPMINRNLYSYSVGSIFKLVTSCEAINEKYAGYMYECTGYYNVNGKEFRCHKHEGHGLQSMTDAIVNSCNTYFISLSQLLSVPDFRSAAFSLGFGREIHLCSGMSASSGNLPTNKELRIPAELANFSFGQGKLSATPLHITQLTCSIANGGRMPVLRLIKGLTSNGINVENEKSPQYSYSIDEETADALKEMMTAAVTENENSNARPLYVSAGAKTSTAQTGQYNEKGDEICNAWITGFFPSENPEYAVTVLIEDGGYGNDSAAPIFKEIADCIIKMKEKD